jgi:hypothetical protein
MMLRLALGAAAVLVCAGGCGGENAVAPDRFSGTWKLRDGRTVPIRHVGRTEGERALRALGGRPCAGDAIYFRATYFDALAHLAGCATGNGRRMVARFEDNGRRGVDRPAVGAPGPADLQRADRGRGRDAVHRGRDARRPLITTCKPGYARR